MTALTQIQSIARQHLGDNPNGSDRFCLSQSIECWDDLGLYDAAIDWAIRSLGYSVGVFHPDYQQALAIKEGK